MQQDYDVLIIGAGAAGLFCAGRAVERGLRVLVLERNAEPGRKILISGGGRCNFTNTDVSAKNFISQNPHFCKSALAGFTPQDFLALVARAGISWHEKTRGQLFCDESASQILRLLLARAGQAALRYGVDITGVTHADVFEVETNHGLFRAKNLVVAAGGLSIPKIGASDFAYRLARQFGHGVVQPRPALVPLLFAPADMAWIKPLAGVSTPVVARQQKAAFTENLLFTHRGLSGPAILQISSYLSEAGSFTVDFAPGARLAEDLLSSKQNHPRSGLKAALSAYLPTRLAAHFAEKLPGNLADLSDKTLRTLGDGLNRYNFTSIGTEGFAKAEVTVGGVETTALNSRDCSSQILPGLFFIGEAVDVTGWLGGYNFQWAWASGHAAANGLLM